MKLLTAQIASISLLCMLGCNETGEKSYFKRYSIEDTIGWPSNNKELMEVLIDQGITLNEGESVSMSGATKTIDVIGVDRTHNIILLLLDRYYSIAQISKQIQTLKTSSFDELADNNRELFYIVPFGELYLRYSSGKFNPSDQAIADKILKDAYRDYVSYLKSQEKHLEKWTTLLEQARE